MKQKFQSIDIAAITLELQNILLGYRLQNVYDPSQKVYLLKFAKPDFKHVILIESGIRMHLTDFSRDNSGMPSGFCMKLRKHLRSKRLNAIKQLGVDRIVDMEFGSGEACYHLILEFYASGNMILTDYQYTIIAMLRTVSPEDNVNFVVGEGYPFQLAKQYSPFSRERLLGALTSAGLAPKDQLRKVLASRLDFSQPLIEHLLAGSGGQFETNVKLSALKNKDGSLDEEAVDRLHKVLAPGDDLLREITTKQQKGYIYMQKIDATPLSSSSQVEAVNAYNEFHPYLFCQFAGQTHKEFDTFNMAVDEFFSAIETQRMKIKAIAHETAASKKLDSMKREHESRVEGLEAAQLVSERKARLIEQNLEKVDNAIGIIRSAIASGIDWIALHQMLGEEKIKRNPVALMIDSLKLETNQIVVLLEEVDYGFDEDEDEFVDKKGVGPDKIDIDIGLSAFANARKFYENKKVSAKKMDKTLQASEKAFKSAEQKILREMDEVKAPAIITKTRKPYWFEKFNWFISTENYLVISGRDAQQNEFLVKKHLRKGDAYIHADIPGSSSVICKNHTPGPIPPMTLSQAGTMAIVYSKAWDAKVVTSAYWVNHDQVSKTAQSGEYLSTGSFMIRGKKNYLPPSQLVFGLGLLFKVAEECIPKHLHERRPELRTLNSEYLEKNADIADDSLPSPSIAETDGTSVKDAEDSEFNALMDKYNLNQDDHAAGKEAQPGAEEELTVVEAVESKKKKVQTTRKQKEKEKAKIAKIKDKQSKEQPEQELAIPASDAQKPVRGKKSKLKKIKEKYGDQDEEERRIKMELLASSGKKKEPERLAVKEEPEKSYAKTVVVPKSAAEEMAKLQQQSDGETEAADEVASDDEDDDEEAREEIKKMLEEEGITELQTGEEVDDMTNLDALTGSPFETDVILNAIPVCAPYNTLQSYKYRIKLLPGGLKKGKAAKSALSLLLQKPDMTPLEKEVIKAVPEAEWIQTVLGKVKLTMPGLDPVKGSKSKKSKKLSDNS